MSSKSTFLNSTSKSYALALYELSQENSELDQVKDGISGIKELLDQSSDFRQMVLDPTLTKEEKNKVINKMVEQYNFCQTLKKFLGFLSEKNRLFFLARIIDSFLDLVSSSKGELKAKLLSSKELSKIELKKISNELSKDFKSPINIEYKYDPNLIGGLIIQVGSVMIDTSIKTKLGKLQKSMNEA